LSPRLELQERQSVRSGPSAPPSLTGILQRRAVRSTPSTKKEIPMPAEQRGSTYRTKTGWGLRWYENGRRRFRSGFGSKTAALAYFREELAPRLGLGIAPI
jgi:hypothetical protein